MPEGHSVHRIARQFERHFEGVPVAVSSPQGRFAAGAARLDGHEIVSSTAVGKQMFLEFDHGLWLRIHLGIYGAWDFAGDISGGGEGEASTSSIGAPRLTRLRMSEQEQLAPDIESFPPEPIGAVRVRLLTDRVVADLRGPTACEVQTPEQVDASIAKLGPDPLVVDATEGEERFVAVVAKKPTPIALLLMDQAVVSGIGNVYRAELLFRARLNPLTPGREVPAEVVRELWRDWTHLLNIGVETGRMYTMDDEESGEARPEHWVYKRTGTPCLVCGTEIVMQELGGRKLYWCPVDQA
ncbi:formamidopyrimidine-DNA glycosylase [soil metagenome]